MIHTIKVGDILLFPNKTIGRVTHRLGDLITMRKVSSCKGIYSSKKRIGKPYTYQNKTHIINLQNAKLMGTEKILKILFNGGK